MMTSVSRKHLTRMKQLNKFQNIIFLLGGLFMTVGAGGYAFLICQSVSSVLFIVGAVAFASMQMMQSYDGNNIAVRRLRRIMTLADVFFIIAGLLAFEENHGWIRNMLGKNGSTYITFVVMTQGKWVVILLIAAILELYTTHRISHELDKEKQ